jgi:hypothetical protein
MRKFFMTTFALAAMLCLATSSMALEKKAVLASDRSDDWNAGASCTVSYYNICTGWVWVWSGFGDGGRMGTVFNTCCPAPQQSQLLQTSIFVASSSPPGYGFTGTIAVHNSDANDCPVGAPIASQPLLPTSVFQISAWGGVPVPNEFIVVVTMEENQGIPNPGALGTDHPAAGPTGPQACGTCYPANRVNHSFAYGSVASPVCPGSTFNDGICDAQLFWDATLVCGTVSVEDSSWGQIKGLYR